jgi:hypothetical protein
MRYFFRQRNRTRRSFEEGTGHMTLAMSEINLPFSHDQRWLIIQLKIFRHVATLHLFRTSYQSLFIN